MVGTYPRRDLPPPLARRFSRQRWCSCLASLLRRPSVRMVRVGMVVAVMNPRLERSRPRNARRAYADPGRALLAQHLLGQHGLPFPFGHGDDIGENHSLSKQDCVHVVRSLLPSF
eukprot:COSAG02_NODE_7335_length_3059_cov_1.828716_1_plen_114_part_10